MSDSSGGELAPPSKRSTAPTRAPSAPLGLLDLGPELLLAVLLAGGALGSRDLCRIGLVCRAFHQPVARWGDAVSSGAGAHSGRQVSETEVGLASQAARRLALAHEHRSRLTRRVDEHWLPLLARLERWRAGFFECYQQGEPVDISADRRSIGGRSIAGVTGSLSDGPLTEGVHEFHLQCDSATFFYGVIDTAQAEVHSTCWSQLEWAAGFGAWRYRGRRYTTAGGRLCKEGIVAEDSRPVYWQYVDGSYVRCTPPTRFKGNVEEGENEGDPAGFELRRKPTTMRLDMGARTITLTQPDSPREWVVPGLPSSVIPLVLIGENPGACRLLELEP